MRECLNILEVLGAGTWGPLNKTSAVGGEENQAGAQARKLSMAKEV